MQKLKKRKLPKQSIRLNDDPSAAPSPSTNGSFVIPLGDLTPPAASFLNNDRLGSSMGANEESSLFVQEASVDTSVPYVKKIRLSALESLTDESMIATGRPMSAPRAPLEPPRASKLSSFHPSADKRRGYGKSSSEEVPEASSKPLEDGPAKLARKRRCENMKKRREQIRT